MPNYKYNHLIHPFKGINGGILGLYGGLIFWVSDFSCSYERSGVWNRDILELSFIMEGGAEIDFDDLMDLSTQSLFFQRPEDPPSKLQHTNGTQ